MSNEPTALFRVGDFLSARRLILSKEEIEALPLGVDDLRRIVARVDQALRRYESQVGLTYPSIPSSALSRHLEQLRIDPAAKPPKAIPADQQRGRPPNHGLTLVFRILGETFEEMCERPFTVTYSGSNTRSEGSAIAWVRHVVRHAPTLGTWAASHPEAIANMIKATNRHVTALHDANMVDWEGHRTLPAQQRRPGRPKKC